MARNLIFEDNLILEDMVRNKIEVGSTVVGFVENCNSDMTCMVDLSDCKGSCVIGEIELVLGNKKEVKRVSALSRVGKFSYFKVIEIANGEVVLSRKEVQKEYLDFVKNRVGLYRVIDGRLVNMRGNDLFVDIGYGVIGIMGIDKMAEVKFNSPELEFNGLKELKVIVTSHDNNKIGLSHKELLGNWEQIINQFQKGSAYIGVVSAVAPFGTFVKLHPNLIALADKNTVAEVGDAVSVFIKDIDHKSHRIKLRIVSIAKRNSERDHSVSFKYIDDIEVTSDWKMY